MLITGDFSPPGISRNDEIILDNPDHKASLFKEAVRRAFIVQHVRGPIHFRGEQISKF